MSVDRSIAYQYVGCGFQLINAHSVQEEEISVLQSRSTELDKLSRQMGERNQQIRAFERDLATKEDTIHRLRARLEEIQVTNDQVREDRRCGVTWVKSNHRLSPSEQLSTNMAAEFNITVHYIDGVHSLGNWKALHHHAAC